ncbi:MAG TPA: acylphosphatase [Acidimicrobiales bacterium]|nr:acylphosphatase [Acidimicrobiales bacterium]
MTDGADIVRVRRRVVVTGRVQGVWFRASCRNEARVLGLAGFVRNLPDGSVEAVFEGPPVAVETAVEWCRRGPPRAQVAGIEVSEEPPVGDEGFYAD